MPRTQGASGPSSFPHVVAWTNPPYSDVRMTPRVTCGGLGWRRAREGSQPTRSRNHFEQGSQRSVNPCRVTKCRCDVRLQQDHIRSLPVPFVLGAAIDHNPLSCVLPPSARSAVGAGRVQRDGRAHKSLQYLLGNLLTLVEVDGAPGVAVEAGVGDA